MQISDQSLNPSNSLPKGTEVKDEIFRLLVRNVKDYAIFMLDPQGCVMTWNEGAQRIKGYTADDIIGKHFSQFYTEEAKATGHPQEELEIARNEGSYEEEGLRVRKDGSLFWASVVITAVYKEGTLIGFAKVTRDLTERKAAQDHEKELSRQEQIFRLLVSGVKDYAIFMLDPEGRVKTWNLGAQRIIGYMADEIIGKSFSQFYTDESKRSEHPQKELEIARKVGRYEEDGWRVRKDGTTFWSSVVITAIYEEGELIGFAKVTRDLTERKRAEQQREASARLLNETNSALKNALEVKSRFLSTISHEVRTPIAAIIGLAEVLTLSDFGADNNAIIRNIFDSCKRLLQLLNNVLDTARMQSGKLKLEVRHFPIRAVMGDVRQMIAAEAARKNLEIIGYCDASIPEFVCGDELRVRQILMNIAYNAVKFSDSGEIKISCTLKEHDKGKVVLRFKIEDEGIGIRPEQLETLFEPFEQADESTARQYGGTGLGLSICKDLIQLMGGEIGVESELGRGSKFWFEIPFDEWDCQP